MSLKIYSGIRYHVTESFRGYSVSFFLKTHPFHAHCCQGRHTKGETVVLSIVTTNFVENRLINVFFHCWVLENCRKTKIWFLQRQPMREVGGSDEAGLVGVNGVVAEVDAEFKRGDGKNRDKDRTLRNTCGYGAFLEISKFWVGNYNQKPLRSQDTESES